MSTDNVTFSHTIRKTRTLYCLLPYIQGFYFKKHKKEDEINDIKKVISILENNYILNLKDIKENVKKIEKII